MELRFFSIPVVEPDQQAEELNAFLRLHPQAMIERQLILDGQQSLWAVCCAVPNTTRSNERVTTALAGNGSSKKRVDYRDILAYRNHNEPGNRNRNNGFRLAGALAPMAVASGGSLNQLPDLFHFGGQTQGLRRVSRQCRRSPIAKSLPAGRLMIFALRSH